jgi:hypothetical protein
MGDEVRVVTSGRSRVVTTRKGVDCRQWRRAWRRGRSPVTANDGCVMSKFERKPNRPKWAIQRQTIFSTVTEEVIENRVIQQFQTASQ